MIFSIKAEVWDDIFAGNGDEQILSPPETKSQSCGTAKRIRLPSTS